MSPFLGLVLPPLVCLSHLSSLPFWAGSVRLTQAAGPAARSPEPTGSALLYLLLKQLLVAGSLPSTGCGSVRLSTPAGPVVATDVLLVPSLPCNLLSVRRLDRLGFSISFGSGCAKISNSSGTVVATAQAVVNDLYALDVAPSPCMPNALLATPHRVPLLTLHRRFAHLPIAQLKNVVQNGLVTGVDWVYSEEEVRSFNCNACLASKAHALPFARGRAAWAEAARV
ncbi:BQ5605_C025g10057 [Microbotryum silenes-dioicae]|uniref:BQ5605_C025g10057 protein n=1 Tax=Microbotryum silenes-dioicae TaxID=796604 RepID=A0A2X0PFY3_9BASI|nr:BQ5605_C025g10057 [Microbotryum silenes-dioicae]